MCCHVLELCLVNLPNSLHDMHVFNQNKNICLVCLHYFGFLGKYVKVNVM